MTECNSQAQQVHQSIIIHISTKPTYLSSKQYKVAYPVWQTPWSGDDEWEINVITQESDSLIFFARLNRLSPIRSKLNSSVEEQPPELPSSNPLISKDNIQIARPTLSVQKVG